VAPTQPSGPRTLLNTLISVLIGTILGVGLALLLELLNRPVRAASDIKDMLGIPVLGTIEWKPVRGRSGGIRALMTPRRLLRLN
jgi:capsular polysaccharide biosynthesis protein